MFRRNRSSTTRVSAPAVLFVFGGVLFLLVVVGGSTASATLSDGDVVLGAAPNNVCTPGTNINCTNSLTGIVNTANGGDAFHGFSASGIGLGGFSNTGTGVKGESGGTGVFGNGTGNNGIGVMGDGARGVLGDGVVGVAGDGTAEGVLGTGIGGGGDGVVGIAGGAAGTSGVLGEATHDGGTGVEATDAGFAANTAFKATGKTSFSRSGTVTVAAGSSSATKSSINLTSASLVLTTIQGNQPGVYVQGVTKVTGTSGSFTVHLNKNATANLRVAWFVLS
jgi:hypothetical protein